MFWPTFSCHRQRGIAFRKKYTFATVNADRIRRIAKLPWEVAGKPEVSAREDMLFTRNPSLEKHVYARCE